MITALCLDYARRNEAIEKRSAAKRTDTEYRYLNFKIYDAVAEVVGERFADVYIYEIGRKIGYAKTKDISVCEGTYKLFKKLAKENIAKKLHLVD